jgi:nanoRNase/pAp phosphatase (c-di-AMP/oligoRNAs hydrolase)
MQHAMAEPVLLIVSDRAFVWRGYRASNRKVRRWIGEREADEPNPEEGAFTGDPTVPETYQSAVGDPNLCAVIDIQDPERARGAINALRHIRPEAAVLVITANGKVSAPDIAVARQLEWTDALRVDLDTELTQLESQRCVHDLRQFIEGEDNVPIVVHPDPDPDALASALAVRALLRQNPEGLPIVTLGEMTRPENRRMAELLGMRVTVVTEAELKKFDHVIVVDHQPAWLDDAPNTLAAVIDHHPIESERKYHFSDLRPKMGATASIITEYLCADDERRVDEKLATALLYGIKTDTDSLTRACTPADVKAYAYLLARAELPLLRRLERPSYKPDSARAYGEALAHLGVQDDLAVAFLGELPDEDTHILVDIADFSISLEEITWSAAAAVIDDQLEFTLRHLGGNATGAGDLAKIVAGEEGSGGGHATMARARVPLTGKWKQLANADIKTGTVELLRRISDALEQLRANPPRSSRPAHQEKGRPAASR